MPYKLVMIDPKLTGDVWVRASQVRPGNASVVHHMVVYVLPPGAKGIDESGGDFLAAYAPGMPPRILPEGVAKRVPAGSKLVFQLHYTPRGTKQVDRSRIGLVFADPGNCQMSWTEASQAAGCFLTPSTKTVPLMTSGRSVEPFNVRHFLDADSMSL
jgi:hypothetical protein